MGVFFGSYLKDWLWKLRDLLYMTYTVNSEDLFQPQNAKLAPEGPGAAQPTVALFQPQWDITNPIESRNSPQWSPIWPFGAGPAPVNKAIMALK